MVDNMWVASLNGEEYDCEEFETEKEAIEYLKELEKEELYNVYEGYIGQVQNYVPTIDVDDVIERLNEDSYDDSPEWGGDYLTYVQDEHKQELGIILNYAFRQWSERHGYEPSHFKVKNSKKVKIK